MGDVAQDICIASPEQNREHVENREQSTEAGKGEEEAQALWEDILKERCPEHH